MKRVTLRLPEQMVDELEEMVEIGKYPNRSEAIRTAVRNQLNEERQRDPDLRDGDSPRQSLRGGREKRSSDWRDDGRLVVNKETCEECGRNVDSVTPAKDRRFGDVIDVCDDCLESEGDLHAVIADGGLSITAEELERLKAQPSTTPDDDRPRCPECGSINLRPATGKYGTQRADYQCNGCRSLFDEPVTAAGMGRDQDQREGSS